MKQKNLFLLAFFSVLSVTVLTSCDDDDDIDLPPIGGYNNSDEVASANLVGYWSMDGDGKENKTGTAPSSSVGVSFGAGGVKGQAATFTNGYLYYASALAPLTSGQPFSVSAWVQVKNTKDAPTAPMNVPYAYFQHAVPGEEYGNFTGLVETGQYSHLSDTLVVKSIYRNAGGVQDNINNYGVVGVDYKVNKKAGTNQWVHIVSTYTPTGGTGTQNIFRIYADSVLVSNKNFEDRLANTFVAATNEIIIGGWYNNIPGKQVNGNTWTVPFNGRIDEIRVWKKALTPAEIQGLYLLGKAGR